MKQQNVSLPDAVRTTEDLQAFIADVERVQKALFSTKKVLEQTLSESIERNRSKLIQAAIAKAITHSAKSNALQSLIKTLTSYPLLHLTIAFAQTPESIEKLSNWARELYGETIILDITTDPSLIGGAIVSVDGIYLDHSMRNMLKYYFTEKRQAIEQLLSK